MQSQAVLNYAALITQTTNYGSARSGKRSPTSSTFTLCTPKEHSFPPSPSRETRCGVPVRPQMLSSSVFSCDLTDEPPGLVTSPSTPPREGFIVISTLCVCCASPAACCWCRVSCCLFLMRKMFCLLKYNQSRTAQARDKQVEENQDQSMKGCSVNSERCKNIHRNCNSGHIGLHIHKDS